MCNKCVFLYKVYKFLLFCNLSKLKGKANCVNKINVVPNVIKDM